MKILVIEDERGLREAIKSSLEKEAYTVETADDFNAASEKLFLYEYDCILLDIMLPNGSGFGILQELKKANKTENVIIISAKDSLEDKELGISDAQTVAEVMQTTTHLIQLNRSLHFLSKIENKQFFENQLLSLNQVVHQVVAELEDYRLFKQIDLILDEAETLYVNMDPNLAHILVSNLFKNAIFHNLEQGKVSLKIERKTLTVSNTSLSGKLDEQKIFTRFYRTSGNSKSSGLGLAIVQAICHLYHFPISYTYSKEHTFTITFS